MSQPFTELNSWGGSNVSFTCTEVVDAIEGDIIVCPIPTFNRAHDMGPLTNNGLRITHDLSSLVGNVQLGNISVALANTVSSPNVSIQNLGNMVYRIGNIRTPEDYLAATGIIDLPTDVGNYTFQFTSTVLNQNSNVTFVVNTTVNVDDQVEWIIPNPPYPTGNLEQSLWPLVYGANTTTQFDDTLQTAYVADLENPDAGPYTVTIDTEDYPTRFVLASNSASAVNNTFSFGSNNNGRLTLTGSRSNINAYLGNLSVTTDAGYVTNAHPTQRNVIRSTVVAFRGTGAPPLPTSAGGDITTTNPYGDTSRSYRFTPPGATSGNGPQVLIATVPSVISPGDPSYSAIRAYLLSTTILGSLQSDATWSALSAVFSGNNWTHEFWIRPEQLYDHDLFRGLGMHLGISNGKVWAMLDYTPPLRSIVTWIPNQFGRTDNPLNYARRIENATTVTANQWYHIALVRNNGIISLYVNGDSTGTYYDIGTTTTTASATTAWTPNTPPNIGGYWFGPITPMWETAISGGLSRLYASAAFQGFITDIRISGIPRYTSNFVPPNAPLYNDKNTWFLLNFRNNTVIDDFALPDLGTTIRTMTWTLTNPSGLVSPLTQPYTQERASSVEIGNVVLDRFGQAQSQHTQFLHQGKIPYVYVTAPYTIDGIFDDLVAVGNNFTSTIIVTEDPTPNNTTSFNLVRTNVRDAVVSLPTVGGIINTVNYQFPAPWQTFDISGNVRTQGNTEIVFTPTTGSAKGLYVFDSFEANSVTAPQNSLAVQPSFQDNRVAWRWLNTGSEFSDINGIFVRVESIQLQDNVGGWTRSGLQGTYYGDWTGIRNYSSSEFRFGVRVYAVGIPSLPQQSSTHWAFSPRTNRNGLGSAYLATWVQQNTNFGLFRSGPYTVGDQGYFTSAEVTYGTNTNKPLQIDVASNGMASLVTTKYATVTVTVYQGILAQTIPVPGGGVRAPVSYTQTFSLLYG